MSLTLALDQGGHASRAVAFDGNGQAVAAHQVAVGVQRCGDLQVEQDPEELVASLRHAIEAVHGALADRGAAITSVGLATQRASIVCWDHPTGAALSPVLSWQDRRARAQVDALAAYAPMVAQHTGLRLSPHYGASKLRWCLDQLPAVQQAHREGRLCLGPLASFLAARLLQEHPCVADPANAARTLLWHAERGEWDERLLELFGVPRDALPSCRPTLASFGGLKVGARVVPLTCLTGDQAAALFGFGEPAADTLYCNIGTGAFVQALLPPGAPLPSGLLRSVVLDDGRERLAVMEGTVNGAGAAITWAVDVLGLDATTVPLGAALAVQEEPPIFLNGIGGLGAPFWQPAFTSRFIGEGGALPRLAAVAESIVFLLAVIVARMREAVTTPARLIVSGGLSALDPLCQRLADITELVIERPAEHEATARGVAYLACGRPRRWGDAVAMRRFAPRSNTPLARRYARWFRSMQAPT